NEIKDESQDLEILVKILSLSKKERNSEKGSSIYHYGLMGDETGVIPFTAWNISSMVREKDIVEIKKAYSKKYNDKIRVYFDDKTEFAPKPEIDIEVKRTYTYEKIRNLGSGEKYVVMEGILHDEKEKEFISNGEKRKMYSYVIEDETGSVRLSSFGRKLPMGKGIRLEGVKVEEFNGRINASVGEKAEFHEIELKVETGNKFSYISEIKNPISGIYVVGFGISFGEKSGLIKRCKECKKKMDDERCEEHPEAKFSYDLFVYFNIDDGTGYVSVTSGFEPIKSISGIKNEELENERRPPLKKEIFERIEKSLMGKALKVEGNLSKNTMGMSLRASMISLIDDKMNKNIKNIMEAEFL
ncbi:replication factor A, partial [mine drainage metagenome]